MAKMLRCTNSGRFGGCLAREPVTNPSRTRHKVIQRVRDALASFLKTQASLTETRTRTPVRGPRDYLTPDLIAEVDRLTEIEPDGAFDVTAAAFTVGSDPGYIKWVLASVHTGSYRGPDFGSFLARRLLYASERGWIPTDKRAV